MIIVLLDMEDSNISNQFYLFISTLVGYNYFYITYPFWIKINWKWKLINLFVNQSSGFYHKYLFLKSIV